MGACFAAQQGAEKAVKALHLSRGQEAWGHVIAKLLRELPTEIHAPGELVEKGRVLGNFYPATLSQQASGGAPFEHYGPLQSAEALEYACEIIQCVGSQMA